MPRPIETELRVGNGPRRMAIGTETRYIMGSTEGPWWFNFSWWVIPLGLILIFGPWFLYFNGNRNSASASQPRVIERVIERPAPAPAPAPAPKVQPAPTPRQLTPEERAEQYKEERRRQYGVQ